jgi:hypothetical protein
MGAWANVSRVRELRKCGRLLLPEQHRNLFANLSWRIAALRRNSYDRNACCSECLILELIAPLARCAFMARVVQFNDTDYLECSKIADREVHVSAINAIVRSRPAIF